MAGNIQTRQLDFFIHASRRHRMPRHVNLVHGGGAPAAYEYEYAGCISFFLSIDSLIIHNTSTGIAGFCTDEKK